VPVSLGSRGYAKERDRKDDAHLREAELRKVNQRTISNARSQEETKENFSVKKEEKKLDLEPWKGRPRYAKEVKFTPKEGRVKWDKRGEIKGRGS